MQQDGGEEQYVLEEIGQESQPLGSIEIGPPRSSAREEARLITQADRLTLILFICQHTNHTKWCGTAGKGKGGKVENSVSAFPNALPMGVEHTVWIMSNHRLKSPHTQN